MSLFFINPGQLIVSITGSGPPCQGVPSRGVAAFAREHAPRKPKALLAARVGRANQPIQRVALHDRGGRLVGEPARQLLPD